MNHLIYMKEGAVDDLKKHISYNKHYYNEEEPWLDNFFKKGAWSLSSKIKYNDIKLVKLGDGQEKAENDLINTKLLYGALEKLSLTQASDERLWVALSHTVFWDYMRSRWPANDYDVANIKERYFLINNRSRALVRNGIARLWWYGYTSYDENRLDPFELTGILCKTTDIAASLCERAFSHNNNISLAILSQLKEREDTGDDFIKREVFRDLMKYLNQIGGASVIDFLSQDDLKEIISDKIKKVLSKVA